MVAFFSDHFGDGVNVAATDKDLDFAHRTPPGIGHGRYRYKRASATNVLLVQVVPDQLRMMTFKSNDRLVELLITSSAVGVAGEADVGLYLSGIRHTGAIVDINMYGDAQDFILAADREDLFTTGALETDDRGKALWEQVNDAIPATYAADPQVQFDITITGGTTFNAACAEIILEAWYTSGD